MEEKFGLCWHCWALLWAIIFLLLWLVLQIAFDNIVSKKLYVSFLILFVSFEVSAQILFSRRVWSYCIHSTNDFLLMIYDASGLLIYNILLLIVYFFLCFCRLLCLENICCFKNIYNQILWLDDRYSTWQ